MPLRELCNTNDFMNFVKNDMVQYEDEYEIHALTADTKEYLRAYPELQNNKKIHWHFLNTNNGTYLTAINKTDYIEKDKKAVLYFNSIGVDMARIVQFNPN